MGCRPAHSELRAAGPELALRQGEANLALCSALSVDTFALCEVLEVSSIMQGATKHRPLLSYCEWLRSSSHHFQTIVATIVSWYLQGNHQKPGFCRWCRIVSIHGMSNTYDTWSLPFASYSTDLQCPSIWWFGLVVWRLGVVSNQNFRIGGSHLQTNSRLPAI